jgi:hypothetical protein
MTNKRLDARSLLVGLAAGAGAILAGNAYLNRHPERAPTQLLVNRALDRKYRQIKEQGPIRLGSSYRYAIFSDHHKGARNRADNFRQCEQTYLAALDHYHAQGFTLVVLGDVEELQEERIERVVGAYPDVLRREAAFHPDRLIRVYGNHDQSWQLVEAVKEFMDPFFPGVAYREGLLFEVTDPRDPQQVIGEVFLIHGNQGTLDSDVLGFIAPLILPYYRNFQINTGLGVTDPSRDACLRSKHDNRMYRWVSRQRRMILIAGHTHRPVWSSKTHLDKLTEELYGLLRLDPGLRPADFFDQVERKRQEIEERQKKYPPCDDIVKTKPAYFNTGCCRYEDGDITGIEMEDGLLRLVKWGPEGSGTQRAVLEENELAEFFLYL